MKYNRRLNKRWQYIETTPRYREAVRKNAYKTTKVKIIGNCLDGILLSLNIKNRGKSLRVQYRTLRKIVEKRLAQASHSKRGYLSDRAYRHLVKIYTGMCLKAIRDIQNPKM